LCSARSLTATPGGRRRNALYDEDDDLTKDMDDPTPEPNIQETSLPRVVNVKSHRDADSQPIRGGTLLDIDEESEVSHTRHRFVLQLLVTSPGQEILMVCDFCQTLFLRFSRNMG